MSANTMHMLFAVVVNLVVWPSALALCVFIGRWNERRGKRRVRNILAQALDPFASSLDFCIAEENFCIAKEKALLPNRRAAIEHSRAKA